MKYGLALTFLGGLASQVASQQDQHLSRSPHVWIFASDGVHIYTPDGSEEVKSIPPERACHELGTPQEPNLRCQWSDTISDDHKYVWASISRGKDMIDVFSIHSGTLVGSFATCGSPRDLDHHRAREEMWVHCGDYSTMKESHMDVFSTSSPAVPITTNVTMHDNTAARSYGVLALDESLGDIGYATVYGQNYIYKISLSERRVLEQVDIDTGDPKLHGLHEMAYSSVNQHLFLRTQVCCTCGFAGADSLECGHYSSENITIDGVQYEGQCGQHCIGSSADNIGIFEYDTINNAIVGSHQFDGTAAVGTPFASPDGKYVVFPGLNGGRSIEIVQPGANGALSTNKQTLSLDFDTAVDEEIVAFDDFAWVQTDDMNLFVLASSIDFKVAVVDMSTSPPTASYVMLDESLTWPNDESGSPERPRDRQVEWIKHTNYVWVSGRVESQNYVIDVSNMKVVKILPVAKDDIVSKILSVQSGQYAALEGELRGSAAASANDETQSNGLSIAALAISCLALVAVLSNFLMSAKTSKAAKDEQSLAGKKSVAPPSVA